ncbi:MAG: ATP-binding cassette domain-containing protein [Bacteroidota bacterium]
MGTPESMIEIKCTKSLNTASGPQVLRLDLSLPSGRCIGVFGDSGVGKTTLLRLLAGLESPDSGRIKFKDTIWFDSKYSLPPQARKVGIAFQHPALFPHLTVRQNMLFGSDLKNHDPMFEDLLKLIEMEKLADQYPRRLSGGQQQRVAFARALIARPELLLMDEPFTGLDQQIKSQIMDYFAGYRYKQNLSTFLVSHSITDVYRLCDVVVLLEDHQVKQVGSPESVFGASSLSGSIRQHAVILDIEPSGVVYILTLAIGQQIAKMVAHQEELDDLKVGDWVQLETKAFSPILRKFRNSDT